jgi:hypothetical protein
MREMLKYLIGQKTNSDKQEMHQTTFFCKLLHRTVIKCIPAFAGFSPPNYFRCKTAVKQFPTLYLIIVKENGFLYLVKMVEAPGYFLK